MTRLRANPRDVEPMLNFWDQLTNKLVAFFRRKGVPPEEADEIVQEIYLILKRKYQQLLDPPSVETRKVAFGIAKHLLQARRRKQGRQYGKLPTDPTDYRGETTPISEWPPKLVECLDTLSDVEREVLLRHYINDEEYDTIARDLQINTSTVRSYAHRGKQKLRRCLESKGFSIEDYFPH